MLDAGYFPDSGFKFADQRPVVGEPPTVKDFTRPLQKAVPIAKVRPTDVQWLDERGRTPEDGEMAQLRDCLG